MRFLVDILYLIALLFYSPVLLYRMLVVGKDRRDWGQRLGRVPRRDGEQPLIWIHAVSMGEANATVTLVEQIRRTIPGCRIAISATTDTGYARVGQLYPDLLRFRYPLDFSLVVRRVFDRIRPSAIVLMELEVWPNLTGEAWRRGVAVIVANGRLTERAMKRYRMFAPIVRPMFARLFAVCAQDQAYADRFVTLGVRRDRIVVTGSVKYDTAAIADTVAGQEELSAAMGLSPDHLLLVAGSTGPGEEEILLRLYQALRPRHKRLRLAIIPRKPERFDEVASLIERSGFNCWRRSQHTAALSVQGEGEAWSADTVVLGDTMGELRKFYALSSVVFVGRSLVPLGGSDVMEVAALGLGVLVGPHMENFVEPVERLTRAGGLRTVRDGDELAAVVEELLSDSARRSAMASAAREAVRSAQGATERTVKVIVDAISRGSKQ
jgi:3-deoxy-D-manno-octulosonic-acid transferase